MVRYDLTALQARDPVARSSSPTLVTGAVADEGRVDELSAGGLRQFPARGSEFQSFVDQVAELARIFTGASGSAIAFRGEHGTSCCARSGQGGPPLGAPVDVTSGISKQCLDSGAPVWCGDVSTDSRV